MDRFTGPFDVDDKRGSAAGADLTLARDAGFALNLLKRAGNRVVEALVVGVIFGGLGAGLGAVIVSIVGKIGIPAKSDIWFFFFSGPRLHPFIGTSNIVAAFIIVLMVSAFSSFYPAWIAMRVTPRQAMAEEE